MSKTLRFTKSIISIILVISMLASLCACSLDLDSVKSQGEQILKKAKDWSVEAYDVVKDKFVEWYGTAKDAAVYVYDEAASATVEGYEIASKKASEIIGDASEYIKGLTDTEIKEVKLASSDSAHPIKDLFVGQSFSETGAIIAKDNTVEQFVAYYISSVLAARGYQVYNGAVYYKENVYGGLIFTKGDVFIEEDGNKIYSCGFVQLIGSNYNGVKITDNMVSTGLIAVSTATRGEETKSFIVDEYASLDDFSGIFENNYFSYRQLDHYVVQVEIKENQKKNYDKSIELYDFDNGKTIYSGKEDETSSVVAELYATDEVSFTGAVTTVNAIADIQENSSDSDISTILVLDGDTLNSLVNKAKNGSQAVVDFVADSLKKINIKDGQFLNLNSKGKVTLFGDPDTVDEERITNGIISTVGAGLGVAGSVASIVITCAGGVVAIKAIVITTGTMAIVYNVSNIIEGIEDIYYGSQNSEDEALNPVLQAFKKVIKDEETANIVYHCWGIGNTLITNLMMPVSKALNIAKVKGLNAFQTGVNVVRASVTQLAKAAAAGVGAGVVNFYVSKIVAKVTNNENIGKLAGFGTSLVSAMLIYGGLDKIDQKLDISGLYPKDAVLSAFKSEVESQKNSAVKNHKASSQKGEDEEAVNVIVDAAKEYIGLEEKPNVKIIYDPSNSADGYYDPYNNTLMVNMRTEENSTLTGLADTIGHEMEHAYQYQIASANPNSEIAYSLNNYVTPESGGWAAYRNQLCEADAFEVGKQFSTWFIELLSAA